MKLLLNTFFPSQTSLPSSNNAVEGKKRSPLMGNRKEVSMARVKMEKLLEKHAHQSSTNNDNVQG